MSYWLLVITLGASIPSTETGAILQIPQLSWQDQ
jgi:hypothetical protein